MRRQTNHQLSVRQTNHQLSVTLITEHRTYLHLSTDTHMFSPHDKPIHLYVFASQVHAELKSLYRVYALNPVFGIEFSVEEKPEATERRAAARVEDNVEIVDVEDGMESLAVRDRDTETYLHTYIQRERWVCASLDCPICTPW